MTDLQAAPDRFRQIFQTCFDPVLGYALRRADSPEDAADVVSETFLVVWRRLDEAPADPLPWAYGIARRTAANQLRGRRRRDQLGARLRSDLALAVPDFAERVAVRADLERQLAGLSDTDREVLELAAWEGLASAEIAEVLGVSAATARARLSRARARFREATPAWATSNVHPLRNSREESAS